MENKNIRKDSPTGQKSFDWQLFWQGYFPLILIFVFSLLFNLLYFSWGKAPIHFNDSASYLSAAESLRHFRLPNLSVRTPVYPLYLSFFLLFNKLNWAIFSQVVIGAFSSILLYLIVLRLIKIHWLAFVFALFLALDFGVSNFQSTILTETLAVFLLLLFVYLRGRSLEKKLSWQFLVILLIADIALIFVKPNFIILPIIIYFLEIVFILIWQRKRIFFKKNLALFSLAIIINLAIIFTHSGINYLRYGFFGFTAVSDINLLGKAVQYGYIDPNKNYDNPPTLAQETLDIVNKYGKDEGTVIFRVDEELAVQGKNTSKNLKEISNYFLKGKKGDFAEKTLKLIPRVFTEKRTFYSQPSPKIMDVKLLALKFNWQNKIFNLLNKFKFIGFLVGLPLLFLLLYEKKKKEFMFLALIIIISIYNVVIITAFAFNEYYRSRTPVEFLLNLLIFTPILYLAILMRRNDKQIK
jgi:4-amino-4-deoxy-L-arabinose transferase-like glycosyltransferase